MEVPSIFLNKILSDAAKNNANALFLNIGNKPIIKVNDNLVVLEEEEFITSELLNKIIENMLTKYEYEKLSREKEIKVVKIFGGSFRFRVFVFFQRSMLSVSFSYIQPVIRPLDEIKLPPIIKSVLKADSGLVIVAGPYGSGKTSTCASLLEEINKTQAKNIVTIEDPIEYVFVGKKSIINQRQLGTDIADLPSALDFLLEEDNDVIYISSLKEESEKCNEKILELAAGNSLVIMEMNTDNSIKVLQKIINGHENNEAARYNLADVLLAVIVQKLVPVVGGSMALAIEVLIVNSAIKSLIREGKIYQIESVIQTSRHEGMISMDKSLEELYRTGQLKQNE